MKVNSFDVFDTLIARRCVEPTDIFDLVALRTGVTDFKSVRIDAEKAVIHTNYKFQDIYNEIQRVHGLDDEVIKILMDTEMMIELENCIPITENLNKVQNGDLLISDMYHSSEFILTMLKKCGLNKEVTLIVTSGGKHTGKIWNHLLPHFNLKSHCGDNLHSDIKSPLSFNIHAEHTELHKFNQVENDIYNSGFKEISKLIRELRLLTLDEDDAPVHFKKLEMQLTCNIPILILTAIYLKFISTKLGSDSIHFSSRDCFYLFKIYQHIFKGIDESNFSRYFYTSRFARINPSLDYEKYFLKNISSNSLIVDLCGTGNSLESLYQHCNINPSTFFIHKLGVNQINGYKPSADTLNNKKVISFVESVPFDNGLLEMINYVGHGMTTDVLHLAELDVFYPKFEDPDYPIFVQDYINLISSTMNKLFNKIDHYPLQKIITESFDNIENIPQLVYNLYANLNNNKFYFKDIEKYHRKQDAQTMLKLQKNVQ
jgi:hypothetical protein